MFKIIVVDDEKNIRELISRNINNTDNIFEVVGVAENGEEAFELIKKLKPDILITDICMPKIDGIELLDLLRKENINIKSIIISGYDEFDYAKKAMRLGVYDYLLKPFMPNEMYDVLNRIAKDINEKNNLSNNIIKLNEEIIDNRLNLQEYFFYNLLNNNLNEDELEKFINEDKFNILGTKYITAVLNIAGEHYADNIIKDFIVLIKDSYFSDDIKLNILQLRDNRYVLFFSCNSNVDSFIRNIDSGLNNIIKSFKKYYNLSINVVFGRLYNKLYGFKSSYEDAISLLQVKLLEENTIVYYSKYINDSTSDEILKRKEVERYKEDLIYNIELGKKDVSLDILEKLFSYYDGCSMEFVELIKISLIEVILGISTAIKNIEDSDNSILLDKNIAKHIDNYFLDESLLYAKEFLKAYIENCINVFTNISKSKGEILVKQMKDLISKNFYNENLNLDMLSSKLYFSSNYLRQIFKQQTGESFMEYTIRLRMEEANKLLRRDDIKIRDVAEKVGYKNQRYFSSCYKKYYGVTPTEYKIEVKNG